MKDKKRIEKIKNKIEELEETLFYIEMIDYWTKEDKDFYHENKQKLNELKQLLVKEIIDNK